MRKSPHGATGVERTVRVELGERSYAIEIGVDVLGGVGHEIRRRTGASRAMLVTVPPVGRRYGPTVMRSLREAGIKARRFDVPDGERTKNLRQASSLYDAFLDAGADRSTAVVALGGGVVGDLAGFVAATLLRGLSESHADPFYAELERDLLARINASGIGPQGLGGDTTALAVLTETAPCHIASLPVAVNIECHSHRHKTAIL